ncbi:hypothetical protein CEW46_26735 [Bacillus cereus]|nr:hypothetical protein CEW46_26735 [Bacillus cereus]
MVLDLLYHLNSYGDHYNIGGVNMPPIDKDLGLIDVRLFGAKGDGITDDTAAIQNAIDYLGTYKYTHPNPPDITSSGGGIIVFPIPPKFYKVTNALKYKSGVHFKGSGWGCIIKLQSSSTSNLFEPDTSKLGSFNSHHDVSWSNLNLVGDRSTTNGVGVSENGIDALNTRYANVSNCVVTGFKTGINMRRDNTSSYGYFNSILNTYCYNNILNISIATNSTQLTGGELSNNYGWTASDYMLEVKSAGVSITGTCIEGSPNIAQVLDNGNGTSYSGVYTETTNGDVIGQKPLIEVDINQPYKHISVNGLHSATLNTLFKLRDYFSSTDKTRNYEWSFGLNFNSGGQFVDLLENTNFKNYTHGWIYQDANKLGKVERVTSTPTDPLVGSDYGLKVTKEVQGTNGEVGIRLYQNMKSDGLQPVYVTALVKHIGTPKFEIYGWGKGESSQYGNKVMDIGNGWYLYVISLVQISSVVGTVAFRLTDSSPVGSGVIVTSIQTYSGGFPLFPPRRYSTVFHRSSIPTEGYFYKGDMIRNTAVTSTSPLGWVCTSEGTPGTWIPLTPNQMIAPAPDGSLWSISVNNLGNLTTTKL